MKLFVVVNAVVVTLLLLGGVVIVDASIQSINIVVFPNPEFVQFTDAYIRAPGGVIDLSQLQFIATSPSYSKMFDISGGGVDDDEYEEYMEGDDDEYEEGGGGDDYDEDGGGGRHRSRRRLVASNQNRHLAAAKNTTSTVTETVPANLTTFEPPAPVAHDTVLDIVVFPLSSKCSKDEDNCDWSTLGVGARTSKDDGDELRWCCEEETVALGLCSNDEYGKLILDKTKFTGMHQTIKVPYEDDISESDIDRKALYVPEDTSAMYVVMFANCDGNYGRDVTVTGKITFQSEHGYLPGELYGFMRFFTVLSIIYIVLFLWFYRLMKKYVECRIDIEKWIMTAISIGCIEMIFKTADYYIWNNVGYRSTAVIWIGIMAGVFKQGFTRCLIVMVSLGWGVIRNSLGSTMHTIICLGLTYVIISALLDGVVLVTYEKMTSISYHTAGELLDVITLLTAVRETIDVIFVIWIVDSLSKTMNYLSTLKNQSHKLQRTQQLRRIMICAVIFECIIAIFTFVDSKQEDGIVHEELAWTREAAIEVNYLFVLISISILWRPNESAREYAYVMELGSIDDENDLELTSGGVPSAMDEDDSAHSNGLRNNNHELI